MGYKMFGVGGSLTSLIWGNISGRHIYKYLFVCVIFASGLVKLGHDLESRVAIFAGSRAEWFISFQGCFRENLTIATIYSSPGDEALIHSLNETQVSTVICDSNQLNKLSGVSSNFKTVRNVIYFNDADASDMPTNIGDWTVISFDEVEDSGKTNYVHPVLPIKKDIDVIMYTSGSTGIPKGVMMTHGNIVAIAAAVRTVLPDLGVNDLYLAYLPLAHAFELEAE